MIRIIGQILKIMLISFLMTILGIMLVISIVLLSAEHFWILIGIIAALAILGNAWNEWGRL